MGCARMSASGATASEVKTAQQAALVAASTMAARGRRAKALPIKRGANTLRTPAPKRIVIAQNRAAAIDSLVR
jgi:hypothetical protein